MAGEGADRGAHLNRPVWRGGTTAKRSAMARRIQILPDHIANQIAAGEVVERPASVVKELVENALDAEATQVEVTLERGGRQRILVADDGVGMGREDALLCLDRHATSKIRRAEDLAAISTLGFRGEALPSIAAVSRLTLETRDREDETGTRIRAEGGRILSVEEVARRPGTTVEVRHLFFNAPARAKFLRGVAEETRAAQEAVVALALAHLGVAFLLRSGRRELLRLQPAAEMPLRIQELWGSEAAETLFPVAADGNGIRVEGWIQRPEAARPGFRRAYLFVNGRPVRDPGVLRAAEAGYRTTLPQGYRPWLFLSLDLPPGQVDVNVHPAKAEVRFRDRGLVEGLVEEATRRGLGGGASGARWGALGGGREGTVRERAAARAGGGWQAPGADGTRRGTPRGEQTALFLPSLPMPAQAPHLPLAGEIPSPVEAREVPPRPRLWQLHHTWILAEMGDGLLIIDQHSAHERILFQRLMEAFQGAALESQRLLFPLTLRLSAAEVRVVEENQGLLERVGFQAEGFGGATVVVHSVPVPHPWFDAERCFREMVAELAVGSELVRSARNQHERIAMTFACKGAIKAGQPLSEPEMASLFEALFATELPFHDVHGRPTIVRLSRGELERKFGRR